MILTWNDGELLRRALTSVAGSLGVHPNVIVVDNGSDPPATVHEGVTLVRNPTNRGVAPARNQGAALGSAPLVCFLDSDAVLGPDSLRQLAAAVAGEDKIGIAVPVFGGQRPEESAGIAPSARVKIARVLGLRADYETAPRAPDASVWDVDFGIGACQVVRREAFQAVDGLDETYFYGPEDVDFCLRVKDRGWRVVQVADAAVDHPARRRNRQLLSVRGLRHAMAVTKHLWRHRRPSGLSRR